AGQVLPFPGQISSTTQTPAAARHTTLEGAKPSGGHAALVPSQLSARSQTPAAGRHTAPAFPAGCGQVALVPLHWSTVQGLPSSVQAVAAGCFACAGAVGTG